MGTLLGVAAEHATARVPTASPDEQVVVVRDRLLRGGPYDAVEDVVVLDHGRVIGLVPIESLLRTTDAVPVAEVMDTAPPLVGPHVDQGRVAHQMVERAESSVAVVDGGGRFVGLIPPHAMLAVLVAENDRALARLGGYLARGHQAVAAAEEPVKLRILHRLPWLLVGLVGAMLTALVVGSFEREIERNVLIAVFVPAVVYMADAVGTQTETVLIRAMAAGVSVRAVAARELWSGLAIGGVVAALFFAFALGVWHELPIAAAVGLALLASCSIATAVAMALPAAIRHFGADPAFGAGPLATVIQDLLSVLVYLAIATTITA